jgi:hypothetical protein
LVILRGDEMADLPTDAVNSRCQLTADVRVAPANSRYAVFAGIRQ